MGLSIRRGEGVVATCEECGRELLLPGGGLLVAVLRDHDWACARGATGRLWCWCPECDAEYVPAEEP